MRIRRAIIAFLAAVSVLCALCTVSAFADGGRRVYAETGETCAQGTYGYAYVYVDDLGDIASLNIAVYYDSTKITVIDHYNQVGCSLYDASNVNGCLQYSYIFDGEGSNERTDLFYFCYYINEDAVAGDTYFDIVVTDAYNKSLEMLDVGGSRCSFKINEATASRECYVWGDSEIGTSVKKEFDVSYYFSVCDIASGSAVITYDPELFEVVSVTNGDFLDGKLVDINSSLEGSIYVSFLSTEYQYAWNFLNIRFRAVKNVDERSEIRLTVSELYDLELNKISCGEYTTNVSVSHDPGYYDDLPSMSISSKYNSDDELVTLKVMLDNDSRLGAGDFVLSFNDDGLEFVSAKKELSADFFNINNKGVGDGELKFSIISFKDIIDGGDVLTVTFKVRKNCEERTFEFAISGNGLTDSLTVPIALNFINTSINILGVHTPSDAVVENRVEPDCESDGSYDSVVYCSVCKKELTRVKKTIDALGHNYSENWTVDVQPTCTTEGSKSRHCSRCSEKADVTVIPANGHSYGEWVEILAPTCTEKGTEHRDCVNCDHFETKEIAELGHKPADVVVENRVEPNCENDGSYDSVVYCSVCGDELNRTIETISALGHTPADAVVENRVEPDCENDGSYDSVVYCSVCGDELNRTKETISALGHTSADAVVENRVEPNCENDGSYDSVVYCSVCKKELTRVKKTIDALGHNYSENWTVDVNPTCTTEGSKSHHCSRCSDKANVTVIPANGHSYGEWVEILAPTCTEKGTERRDCVNCDHFETKEIAELGHKPADVVVENRVEPNCENDGSYDSVVYCSVCKKELTRVKKTIDALGHNYSENWTVDVQPTCTTEGSKSHHCSRCDDKADVTTVPANGHAYGDWYVVTAPTCTATGTDEHKCSVCQHTETRATDALGHTNAVAVVENKVDATCTADGSYDSVVYCSVCNAELSREAKTIGKLGHDYKTEWTVDVTPTCTTAGSKSHHCSRCDNKEDVNEIPANGHSYGDWYETKAPTCTATGTDEHKCSVCQHTETRATDALGHTNSAAVVENKVDATCTVDGSYDSVVYCSVCDVELSREKKSIDKLGHDYKTEWTEDVAPTCTTAGSKSHHCSRCNNKADVTEIPALGHTWGDWYETEAPTCTTTGTDERECSVCHHKEIRTTDALGHANAAAVVENKVDATCTADGSYDSVVYCSVCNAELSREAKTIGKLGHDYKTEWTEDVAPTCTTVGSKSHHCTRCDNKEDVTEIPANGHSYCDWYEIKTPTCTATGTDEHKCSVCQHTETRATDALGHTNAVAVIENKVDATCTADGSYDSVVYCSVCNAELSRDARTISKLGHDYSNEWTEDVEPTCTTVGSKSHHCTRCDDMSDVTEVPANGHSYLTDFVFDEANHWKECACGEKNEITAHTWNNGEVTKEATADEEGVKTYTCTLCSCTKNESIAKLVTNVKDTESGVTLEIPSNSQATLPAGTVIEVVEKSNESISEQILGEFAATAETVVEALGVYDLNLLLDGVKIQPNGAVVVTLPAPKFTAEYDRIIVVFIADDGSYDECKTTVNADGTISFETDHFSKYAVIGVNEEEADDRIGVGAIITIVVGAVLVIGGGAFAIYWFVIKKKEQACR